MPGVRRTALMALGLWVAACSENAVEDTEPERPASLPESAEWRGGLDGGDWVSCEAVDGGLRCSLYWQTGEIYGQVDYDICLNGSLESLHGYGFANMLSVEAVSPPIVLVPTQPPTLYRDGQISPTLTEEARRDWDSPSDWQLRQLQPCENRLLLDSATPNSGPD